VILSVADAANAPPALVVNENVATLGVFVATRSVDAMVNVGLVTLSPTLSTLVPVVKLTLAGLLIVTSVPDAPVPVPEAITTTICAEEAILHDVASVPDEDVLPIFALHVKPAMKFMPVTVMVLPAYAAAAQVLAAVGLKNILSGVNGTVATLAPFVNVNCTGDPMPGLLLAVVLVPITTTNVVALA